jgi:hypothetical protein
MSNVKQQFARVKQRRSWANDRRKVMSDRTIASSAMSRHAISWVVWAGIAVLGAFAFAGITLNHGESVSAAWLVTAAICVYLIAYRFYSKFIADKVLRLDDARLTPAERFNDGLDYVPTNKYVVFGHHFAAIAGAGPLVGPVLAAQMGCKRRSNNPSLKRPDLPVAPE